MTINAGPRHPGLRCIHLEIITDYRQKRSCDTMQTESDFNNEIWF